MNPLRALVAALLTCSVALTPRGVSAQADVIRGKITGADSLPVADARITATSIPGAVVKQTRTDKKGAYQIIYPGGEGDYIIGISAIGHAYKQFEIKRTADQDILIGDARLQPILLDVVTSSAAAVAQKVSRGSTAPDVGGTERFISQDNVPMEAVGNLAAMAASVAGVQLLPGVDGASDGFSVLGLGADQNSVNFNGTSFGGSNLPRDALLTSSIVTSSYDVSRGGYSGAQLSVNTGGGGSTGRHGFNSVISLPSLTWTDRAGDAVGAKATNISVGGIAAAPIRINTDFYSVSYQLGRRSNDLRTLLNTDALGLQAAGVALDSVGRLVDILQQAGIAPSAAGIGRTRTSDNGSLYGGYSYTSPTSASGMAWKVSGNANWSRDRPSGISTTDFPSAGGNRTNYTMGLIANQSDYLKLLLSESTAGFSVSRNYGSPYLDLPSGRVRVTSTLDDGENTVKNLAFGGNPGLSAQSTSYSTSFNNALSWFSDNNQHRLKLTTDLHYDRSVADLASNLLGSFTFNSLEDLEDGVPATYTRQLTAPTRRIGGLYGSMALGDSYRRTSNLQIQYGLRVDATHFDRQPQFNSAVDSTFGVRNDVVPQKFYVSPRIGFSWTVGTAQQVAAFDGAARGPRSVIRGGIGVFQNASPPSLITSALENTGLPSGVQQLYCVGAAAPKPDWAAYDADPSSTPDRCTDGSLGTVFSSTAPTVSLIDRGFRSQRRVSSNLAWSGRILNNRFAATVEGTYAVNQHQQRSVDLNFVPQQRFTLGDEDGRPVFVQPSSIVTATGAIAVRDARVSQAFNRVLMTKSDLRGETQQLTVSLSPVTIGTPNFTYSGSYTYLHGREQVSGFSSTVGNPLDIGWAPVASGAHQINYNLSYNILGYVRLRWNGNLTSGHPFTPLVAGDINGDGSGGNDRAFIFDPSTASDPEVAAAMRTLLEKADGRTRSCLQRQLGHLAERNSCGTPWTSNGSVSINFDPIKFRMPHRARLSMSLSNPLGAADLAINGSNGLKGWGASVAPDQSLLYVRGFDSTTKRYAYEVNPRFGATRPALITLRSPVTLTMQINIDLGASAEKQSIEQRLDIGRRTPGVRVTEATLRLIVASGSIPNPFLTIIANQDSLHLTVRQSDSIAAMSRRFTYRVESLWTPVIRSLAALPNQYSVDEAYDTYVQARVTAITLLETLAPVVKRLLTAEQLRKLPTSATNALDLLYLQSIRFGTSSYFGYGSAPR